MSRELSEDAIVELLFNGSTKKLIPLTEEEQQKLIHYSTFDPAQMLNQRTIYLQELEQYIFNLEELRFRVQQRIREHLKTCRKDPNAIFKKD